MAKFVNVVCERPLIVVCRQKEMAPDKDFKAHVGVGVTVIAGVDLKGLGIRVGIRH